MNRRAAPGSGKPQKGIDVQTAFDISLSAVGKGLSTYADSTTAESSLSRQVFLHREEGLCSAPAEQMDNTWRGFPSRLNNLNRVPSRNRYRRPTGEGMEAEAQYTCLNTWTAYRRVQGIPHPAIEGSAGMTAITRGGIKAKRQATPQLRTPIARRPLAPARGRSLLTPGPALLTPKTQGQQ